MSQSGNYPCMATMLCGTTIDPCKAQPRSGGAGLCTLEAFHKGPHQGPAGTFTRVFPGTSPRSWGKTRIRLRDERLRLRSPEE